jgi:hypothetical protein
MTRSAATRLGGRAAGAPQEPHRRARVARLGGIFTVTLPYASPRTLTGAATDGRRVEGATPAKPRASIGRAERASNKGGG